MLTLERYFWGQEEPFKLRRSQCIASISSVYFDLYTTYEAILVRADMHLTASVPRGGTRDEGRPLGVGLQERAPNHLKLQR
jgi:hypothetical protein